MIDPREENRHVAQGAVDRGLAQMLNRKIVGITREDVESERETLTKDRSKNKREAPGETCELCGHDWTRHNKFMGEKKAFGCVECGCKKYK